MYAERCSATATEADCESLWNINVQLLHGQLVAGTLGIDELRFACRCVFLLSRRLFIHRERTKSQINTAFYSRPRTPHHKTK